MALGARLVLTGPASEAQKTVLPLYMYGACPGPQHRDWLSNGPMPAAVPEWRNASRLPGSAFEAQQQFVELSS